MIEVCKFLYNRGLNYSIIGSYNNQPLINLDRKFLLVPHDYDTRSNLEILKIDTRNDKWIALISKKCNLKISKDMIKFYHHFKKNNWYNYDKNSLNMSMNSIYNCRYYYSLKIIKHYHKSIKEHEYANINVDIAMYDRKMMISMIISTFIYFKTITTQNCLDFYFRDQNSLFYSPFITSKIIKDYYPDCEIVIDPFSEFSARMLGSIALNKKYFGANRDWTIINESDDILDFIKKEAYLECNDFKKFSIKKGDLLLTSISNSEISTFNNKSFSKEDDYINWILKNYKCKKYIFIVKETNYRKNIVRKISFLFNNKKCEKILLFE